MHYTIDQQLGIALLCGTLALALWKGGFPERVGACLNVGNGVVTMALHPLLTPDAAAIATLVERVTRFLVLVHLPDGYKAPQLRDAPTRG